jgi:hypothetical protein
MYGHTLYLMLIGKIQHCRKLNMLFKRGAHEMNPIFEGMVLSGEKTAKELIHKMEK